MHHPGARAAEGRAGAVGTDRCDHTIFGDVTHVGEHPLSQSGAWAARRRPYDVGSHQQVFGILGDHRAAAACGTVARRGGAHVHRTDRINAAIFQDPNVDRDRCGTKFDGDSVGAGSGSQNILGVINSLRQGDRARQHRWAHGQLIDIAFRVGQ